MNMVFFFYNWHVFDENRENYACATSRIQNKFLNFNCATTLLMVPTELNLQLTTVVLILCFIWSKIFESHSHMFVISKYVWEIKKAQVTGQCRPHSVSSVRSLFIEHSSISFPYSLNVLLCDLGVTGATQPVMILYGLHKAKTLLISQSANSFIRNYAIRFIFILGNPGATKRDDAISKISHRPV